MDTQTLNEQDLESLKNELRTLAVRSGVELFGVADLLPAMDFIVEQGGGYLDRFPRAVSLGIPLSRAVVEPLGDLSNHPAAYTYHHYIYEIVNRQLDLAAQAVAARLERYGLAGYVVPSSLTVNSERQLGLVSQKVAAHLSGLGFIGKSCLLVNPDHGARVRFATVLTDASLPTDSPTRAGCGDCQDCVDICPPKAIKGVEFRPEDPREARFDPALCERYRLHREKTMGRKVCGLCVWACRGPAGDHR